MQYTIHRFDSIDSTNDEAIRLSEAGAEEGTIVIALEQSGGKGRRGRSWSSPPGCGLYLSVVLRPGKPFSELGQLAFVAAVAAAESIRKVSGLDARIKWPNDILINGRKVIGILIEARQVKEHESDQKPSYPAAIIGIGINVNTLEFPAELAGKATSIYLSLIHI